MREPSFGLRRGRFGVGLALALVVSGCVEDSYADGLSPQWTSFGERSAEGMTVSGAGDVVVFGAAWVDADVELPWITRVSAAGEERWTRWYSAATEIRDVRVTTRGELFVASEPALQFPDLQPTCSSLARLHANGASIWARDYDSPGEGCFRGVLDMVARSGGGVEVVDYYGAWLRYDDDGAATLRSPAELPAQELWDRGGAVLRGDGSRVVAMSGSSGGSAIVYLSPEGEVQRVVPTTGSIVRAIAARGDGGIVIAGAVELPGEMSHWTQDRWVGSLDADGEQQWEQLFPGEGSVRRSEIAAIAIAPGDYAIAVGSEDSPESESLFGDGWIGVFSPTGALVWEEFPTRLSAVTGELIAARPRWVAVDDDGAVYVGGDGGGLGFWVSRYEVGA